MDRVRNVARSFTPSSSSDSDSSAAKELAKQIVSTCQAIEKEDLERCITMSKLGAQWLVDKIKREKGGKDKLKVMTVCNTGSLATSVSTALSAVDDQADHGSDLQI
jgi:methylthioribose-1-phosphate isomerase